MRYCFAGSDGTESYNAILRRLGVKSRLESAFSLGFKRDISRGFEYHLLDSGGFVARTKGQPISLEMYAAYLNKHKIELAVNLDTADVKETEQNLIYLRKHTKTIIVDVYHMSDYLTCRDILDRMLKDRIICIGGVAGVTHLSRYKESFYNYVFSRTRDVVRVHGLGITKQDTLKAHPFYSVDSTSWLAGVQHGSVKHISDKVDKALQRSVKYTHIAAISVKQFLDMERQITNLWLARGVKWTD